MPFRWSRVCLAVLVSGLGISTLQAAGDFSLSASPSSRTVASGGSTTYTITVTKSGNFSGTVSFTTTGLPTGGGASYSPTTVTGSGSTTMTVTTTAGTTPAGNSTIAVKGTSGALNHTVNVTLVVTDFSLSESPSSQTVSQGNTTPAYTTTVSLSPLRTGSSWCGWAITSRAYISADGSNWVQESSAAYTMASTVYVGLAVTSEVRA